MPPDRDLDPRPRYRPSGAVLLIAFALLTVLASALFFAGFAIFVL